MTRKEIYTLLGFVSFIGMGANFDGGAIWGFLLYEIVMVGMFTYCVRKVLQED